MQRCHHRGRWSWLLRGGLSSLTVAYQTRSAASVRGSLIRDTRMLHRRLERPLPFFTWTKTPTTSSTIRSTNVGDATLVTIASPGRAARDVPSQASVA
jgi:hypothetical protein